MVLTITGIGFYRVEEVEDAYQEKLGTIKTIDVNTLMHRNLKRLSGRLAKMFYIAIDKALSDAQLEKDTLLPIIAGSGISEVDAGQELVRQIQESRGSSISPTLVQNSVHNAPVAFVSIGMQNTSPILMTAHSFLCWEASLDYAFSFISSSDHTSVIVVSGDQYKSSWIDMLSDVAEHELKNVLEQQNLREGVMAMVLTSDNTKNSYGSILQSAVIHLPDPSRLSIELIESYGFIISDDTQIHISEFCKGFLPDTSELIALLDIRSEQIIYHSNRDGVSLATPFTKLMNSKGKKCSGHHLFLNSEYNDLSMVEVELNFT